MWKTIRAKNMNTKYYIDDEKKTIVAKTENTKTFINELWDQGLYGFIGAINSFKRCGNICDPKTDFVGKAVCSPKDEYDEEVGKKIAAWKADLKYHKYSANRYGDIISRLQEVINRVKANMKKHENCCAALEKKLEEVNNNTL